MTAKKKEAGININLPAELIEKISEILDQPANFTHGARGGRRKMFYKEFLSAMVDQATHQARLADELRELAHMIRAQAFEHSKLFGSDIASDGGNLAILDYLADQLYFMADSLGVFVPGESDIEDQERRFEQFYKVTKRGVRQFQQMGKIKQDPAYKDLFEELQRTIAAGLEVGPEE